VIAALSEPDLQIINYVRRHGRATMADMVRVTGTSHNTLKDHSFRTEIRLSRTRFTTKEHFHQPSR
jgi:hypothetical protein